MEVIDLVNSDTDSGGKTTTKKRNRKKCRSDVSSNEGNISTPPGSGKSVDKEVMSLLT